MDRKFHPLIACTSAVGMPYAYKKGGSAPDAPDYDKLAQAQTAAQIAINRQTTKANRPNQYTPWGSIEWTQGTGGGSGSQPSFDQAGYDEAVKAYQAQQQGNAATGDNFHTTGGWNPLLLQGGDASNFQQNRTMGAAPTREQFMRAPSGADNWSSTMKLDPELQKILDNEFSTKQQGYSELQSYLSNINDPNKVNAAPIAPGQTAQDAIMARLNPTLNQREEADRTRLYNQGVRPGTEAWDNEMRNFNNARNDAYSQAALQGIGLDTQARQNSLLEQGLPLNAINSFLSGSSVQNPGFGNFSQQATAQAPDLLGAAQSQYGADLNSYNASQASGGNMLGGLFGLGGALLGGPAGGALGAALGGGLGGGMSAFNSGGFSPYNFA
jgi:hypothetical protein